MRMTTGFECGNGKNIRETAPGHFRIDERGEKSPYCKYFCVRVDGDRTGGPAHLSVYPDPDLGEEGRAGFIAHYPSPFWFSETDMRTWQMVVHRWPGADRFASDHIETAVSVNAGGHLHVASNIVWPYSHLLEWAAALPLPRAELGRSFEGRSIPCLHLRAAGKKRRRILLLSGQHPSEHAGPLAVAGIVEFLLSAHQEASALRRACEVWAVPLLNVDGNVHGRNGWTLEDVNPCTDFAGAADGARPRAVEDRLLWNWRLEEVRPEMIVHFHGFLGMRGFSQLPGDGCYLLQDPEAVFRLRTRAALYRRVEQGMLWDTPAWSSGVRGDLDETMLDRQLARRCGTIPVFYEINHGSYSVEGARHVGADVFRAAARALLRAS